jgi:hypothetical protein
MLTWYDFAQLNDDQLSKHDLAEVHLACAVDLPGAEKLDIPYCLEQLKELTQFVALKTERHLPDFLRDPHKYNNSEPYFRMLVLATALRRDRGIGYNLGRVGDLFFDAADSFLFGIFQGTGGTCGTLPVVYASVGRRLGYPIKLVQCHSHRFVRWVGDDGIVFNIETTAKGLATPPDEHYREGPFERTKQFEEYAGWMRPLTPRRELASFLDSRATIWFNEGFIREAVECQSPGRTSPVEFVR